MLQVSNFEDDTLLQIDILEPYQPTVIDQICEVIECMYIKPMTLIYNTLPIQDQAALAQFIRDFSVSPLPQLVQDYGHSVIVIDSAVRLNAIRHMDHVYTVHALADAFGSTFTPAEKIS